MGPNTAYGKSRSDQVSIPTYKPRATFREKIKCDMNKLDMSQVVIRKRLVQTFRPMYEMIHLIYIIKMKLEVSNSPMRPSWPYNYDGDI